MAFSCAFGASNEVNRPANLFGDPVDQPVVAKEWLPDEFSGGGYRKRARRSMTAGQYLAFANRHNDPSVAFARRSSTPVHQCSGDRIGDYRAALREGHSGPVKCLTYVRPALAKLTRPLVGRT